MQTGMAVVILLQSEGIKMEELSIVGKSVPAQDAVEKVTGKAVFSTDVVMPKMLYAKLLRSPHAHARILHIDTSKAEAYPGVRLVATGKDCLDTRFGLYIRDERFLAKDEVHYIGDEVAAVVAIDPEVAKEALKLIEVEYEPLPAIFDPLKAIQPGAPLARGDSPSNICHHTQVLRGDIEQGFRQAAVIHEDTYYLPNYYQAYLEPLAATAQWEGDRVTIWASHQAPRQLAKVIYEAFNIEPGSLRFIQTHVGGAFGAKTHMRACPFAALLAKLADAPVQIVWEREEDFATGTPSMPMVIRLKMGVDANGLITAEDVYTVADNGAYTASALGCLEVANIRVHSLYRFNNLRAVADLVYTNKVASSAYRGYGNNQMHFAVESMMDTLAEKLGMDPKEIRLRNATQQGDISVHGWVINTCALTETIERATEVTKWDRKHGQMRKKSRGIGMACGIHVSGNAAVAPSGYGSASLVRIHEDGTVHVYNNEGCIGQGASTIYAQIVAEELGIPYNRVFVKPLDTDVSGFGIGAVGSHAGTIGGNGVRAGAVAARKRLIEAAAHKWQCDPKDVQLIRGKLVNLQLEMDMEISEVATYYVGMTGGSRILGEGLYRAEGIAAPDENKYGNISLGYSFATQIAEVEVDLETGQVTVLKMVAVHDSGRAINPMLTEGQIEGGMIMGMSHAIGEEYLFKDGRLLNPNFANYKVPTCLDIPEIQTILLDHPEPNGPFGAKSIGEIAIVPSAPAVANAIYDAVGVRITQLPITPERLLKAIQEQKLVDRHDDLEK
jgi:CO/xanthine dehydrogenase Mo-binding subunit